MKTLGSLTQVIGKYFYDPATNQIYHLESGGVGSFTPVLAAYRLYFDGTESGSAPINVQDTAGTINIESVFKFHVRVRIDETGGKNGANGDDWKIQYQKNGTGGYLDVTTTSSNVRVDTGSSLTDDAATTNRSTDGISDGSGTFQAGIQEEGNGEITNFGLTASGFTEHVYACIIQAADVVHGDFLEFRVSLNAGTPGFTHSVTPRLDLVKIPDNPPPKSSRSSDPSMSQFGAILRM